MIKHINIKIHGQVQGVFFRDFVQKKADQLGIYGFVRNEPDGTVYVEAEGDEESLKKLIEFIKTGPAYAKVEKVEVAEGDIQNFSDFTIK